MVQIPTLDYPEPLAPKQKTADTFLQVLQGVNTTLEQLQRVSLQTSAVQADSLTFDAENYNINNLDNYRLQNAQNPNLATDYREKQINYNQKLLTGVNPFVANKLSQNLNRIVEKTYQDNLNWMGQQKILKAQSDVQTNIDNIAQYAYQMGSRGTLNTVLDMTDSVISSSSQIVPITPESMRQIYSNNVISYLRGVARDDAEGARGLLDSEMLKKYLTGKQYIDISREINNIANSTAIQKEKNAENILRALEQDVAEGRRLSGTNLNSALFQTLETSNPKLLEKFSVIYENMDALNSLNLASVEEMRKVQAEVKNPYLNGLINQKITTQLKALNTDGLNYATLQGISVSPITDFTDINQMRNRITNLETINTIFKTQSNVFYPEERDGLKTLFANATPEIKLETGLKLAEGLSQYAEKGLKEVNVDDTLIQTVYFGNHDYPNAKNIANNILRGQQIVEDQKPKDYNAVRTNIRLQIAGALPVKFENPAIDRIAALYYQKSFVKGNEALNNSLIRESITEALGSSPVNYRPASSFLGISNRLFGEKAKVLPPINVRDNDFIDSIDNLRDTDLVQYSANNTLPTYLGRNVGAEFIKNNAYFENVSPNAYRLLVRNGAKSEYLMSNNEIFILRLNNISIDSINNRNK